MKQTLEKGLRKPITLKPFLRRTFTLQFALGLVFLSGCSGERFVYAPVSGKVTLNGEPLSEVTVIFVPQGDGKDALTGSLSRAVTNEEGHFQLLTTSGIHGAVVGLHKVAIIGEIRDKIDPFVIVKPEYLHARYHEGQTLTFEVPSDGTDFANFSLTSSPGK